MVGGGWSHALHGCGRLLAPATLTRRVGVIPRRGRGLSSLVRARGFRLAAVLRLATGRHCRHRGSERAGGRVRASVGGAEPSTGRRHATKDVGGDGKKRRLKPRKAHFTDPMAPDIFAIRYFYDMIPHRKQSEKKRRSEGNDHFRADIFCVVSRPLERSVIKGGCHVTCHYRLRREKTGSYRDNYFLRFKTIRESIS